MKITINDTTYEVDMAPLEERAKTAILDMIQSKEDAGGMMIKQAVKGACTIALPYLGLTKPDRNSDPIELVTMHIAGMIFKGLKEHGLALTGEEVKPDGTANNF